MTKMIYSDNVYHREVVHNVTLSTDYYANVLCGVASGDVEVYSFGLPGACGQEFSFYYRDWENKLNSNVSSEALLAMALSATRGWGHANEKCFIPLSSKNADDFIEVE